MGPALQPRSGSRKLRCRSVAFKLQRGIAASQGQFRNKKQTRWQQLKPRSGLPASKLGKCRGFRKGQMKKEMSLITRHHSPHVLGGGLAESHLSNEDENILYDTREEGTGPLQAPRHVLLEKQRFQTHNPSHITLVKKIAILTQYQCGGRGGGASKNVSWGPQTQKCPEDGPHSHLQHALWKLKMGSHFNVIHRGLRCKHSRCSHKMEQKGNPIFM